MRRRTERDIPLSLRHIADWEQRIVRQKQLIVELQLKHCSTAQAEAELQRLEHTLIMLRNHHDVMQNLTKSDSREQSKRSIGAGAGPNPSRID